MIDDGEIDKSIKHWAAGYRDSCKASGQRSVKESRLPGEDVLLIM